MKSKLKGLRKVSLATAVMITSTFFSGLSIHAVENEDVWQLANASVEKKDENDVYLSFGSGQKARITFLNEDVFRIDVEQKGEEFEEYPEPMASTHTTKITAKSESDYEAEGIVEANISEDDNTIEINGGNVKLLVDKETAKMELKNKDGKTVWKEAESLKYDGTETVQTLDTDENEYFYGGGQQNGFFSHKNRKILIENKSTWVSGGVSSPSPFYMSSNGYGAMRNTFQPGSYDFSSTAKLEHDENRFDAYYFVGDNMKDVLGDYVELTGNPMFMPKYAFNQGNADCYNGDGEELLDDGVARAKKYVENDMPVGWFLPNDGYGCGYGKSSDADENIENLNKFVEEAKKYGFVSGLWTENDLDKLDREVSKGGTQMIKTDVAWVGEGYSFGLNAVRQAYEGIENNSDNRGFVVSLDGWAGTQRYAGLWSGDQTGGNWEYIRFHIPTYIGAGLSGNPNVGSDLDGIYGSDKIISTRDFQWKTFTPIEINMDGWTTGAEKSPWYHGEPYTSINRMYLKMKTGFMPYNYTYAKEAHDTGIPMIRGLVLEYPNDPFTWGNQTQYEYMWGENLLVAPVYEDVNGDENGNDVRNNIYLPDKNQIWIDYFTGKQYQGGQVINNFDAPLWKLPLFVKSGAIIPKDVENNSQLFVKGNEDRIFEVYPAGHTEFNLYDDDGMSQEYKEGKGATTLITSDAPAAGEKGDAVITVNPAKGSFTGMEKERGTQFVVNVSERPDELIANVGGAEVELKEVTSEEEFNNAEGNVYFYNEAPDLNHYATKGSEFENQKITTTPKVFVKISKTDITSNEVKLTVKGFVNEQKEEINENDKELTDADIPTLEGTATDNKVSLNWEMDEDVKYGMIVDGNEDAIYRDVTAPFIHDSLNAGEEHTYQLVVYNTKHEVVGEVQRFQTNEDRYKNVIKNTKGVASSEIGGYYASQAVDGDESSLWYTDWEDEVANNSDKIFTIDLNDGYYVDKLEYFNNGTAQIKNHEIQISLDGVNFKTVEQSVWERAGEFRVFVDLKGEAARYVRIVSHDLSHNSANEFRVYKVEGTESFNPASTKGNKEIEDNDITFLQNYMGVTAENAKLWEQARPGDFNYNNEIDAYDLAFTMAQKGLENTGKKAAGIISWSIDKSELKKGETANITVTGSGLKDIYAFGMRLPFGDKINNLKFETVASEVTNQMINMSKNPQNSTDYVVAFSNEGNESALQGDAQLATIKVTALEDTVLNLEDVSAFVVSNGLDVRLALGTDSEPADVAQLENIINAATLDTTPYTSESVAEFNNAISAAKAVLDNPEATQEEMNDAIKEILNSLQKLKVRVSTHVDALRVLTETISTEGPKAGYVQSDLDKLLATVTSAEGVVANKEATPEEIDKMFMTLKEKLLETKDANGRYDASNKIYVTFANVILTELKDVYTEKSLQGLGDAVKEFKDATDDKIAEAVLSLEVVQNVDKAILNVYVAIADAMHLDTYGTEASIKAIEALNEAKTVLADGKATQDIVNEHVVLLSNALISVLQPNEDALKDALAKLVEEAKNIDLSNKTEASKSVFEKALAEAEKVLAEQSSDEKALESAYMNLTVAINGLQEVGNADKTELKEAIDKAEGINLSFYTKDSADALTKALNNAKEVFGNETTTQDVVDEACEALLNAIDSLEKNVSDKPNPTPGPNEDGPQGGNNGSNIELPKTGDTANQVGYLFLLIVSVGSIYLIRKRKVTTN